MPAQTDAATYSDKLIAALGHREPMTRTRAAWLLGKLGDKRAVLPLIAEIKHDRRDPEFLATAAEALGVLRDESAIPLLVRLSRSSFLKVRLVAVEALGQWRAQAVVAKALDAARSDVNAIVRRAAARSLRSATRQ